MYMLISEMVSLPAFPGLYPMDRVAFSSGQLSVHSVGM